jgi:catechol 2,3-dioxygenase-like lactoylglutathione lyase family enzyme
MSLHHASITTDDLERLKRFYCDLLGFEVAFEFEWEAGNAAADAIYGLKDTAVRMSMLRHANAFLELFEFKSPKETRADRLPAANTPGYTHICMQVADIQAEYERLRSAGMSFMCPPQTVQGLCRATYGRDPDGNLVELLEPEPGSAFDPDTYPGKRPARE